MSDIAAAADVIAAHAERELEALVAVSSPSGDVHGAEEAVALCAAFAPNEARLERIPCSSPDHAPDLLLTLTGAGTRRVLLLGHVDTVHAHADHRALTRDGPRLRGSGTVDMKGGDVLALGVLRGLAAQPERYAEVGLLLVVDEEWRTAGFAHAERFAGWDACLCFEAGERTPEGAEGVVVRRKAASALRVIAHGRQAHAGSAPDAGANALLALAQAAQIAAALHDPDGEERRSVVPTTLHTGDAINVVPAAGALEIDIRARTVDAVEHVIAALPEEIGGVRLEPQVIRRWPGMDSAAATAPLLEAASERLGHAIVGVARGGASDASHFAPSIPLTIDGLGPRGGRAHNPEEFVLTSSIRERAEVALAVVDALLVHTSAR